MFKKIEQKIDTTPIGKKKPYLYDLQQQRQYQKNINVENSKEKEDMRKQKGD